MSGILQRIIQDALLEERELRSWFVDAVLAATLAGEAAIVAGTDDGTRRMAQRLEKFPNEPTRSPII